MKTHSREWFRQQIAETKKEISSWPPAMKEARVVATASFPKIPERVMDHALSEATKGKPKAKQKK